MFPDLSRAKMNSKWKDVIASSINVNAKPLKSRKQSNLQKQLLHINKYPTTPSRRIQPLTATSRSPTSAIVKKMNNHPTLSPPTPLEYSLFSPSKAAEQQRLAKDWTYIHNFLSKHYPFPSRVPKFEENEETLKCLLALAAYNEKGDEGWSGLCGVEREVVREMEEGEVSFVMFCLAVLG
jgi:hypothetical protein